MVTRINVAALGEPRNQACIPWPVVFAKAYALVAAGSPPLRRVYVKLPWPHLYELPRSVASIIVERDWPHNGDSGEKALFLCRLTGVAVQQLGNRDEALLAAGLAEDLQRPAVVVADRLTHHFRQALALGEVRSISVAAPARLAPRSQT